MSKYFLSICLLIKDEEKYLSEWISWHVDQGVEHFFIYDNGSQTPIDKSIPSEHKNRCTIIKCLGWKTNQQITAYNDCLQRFGDSTKWMAFIDSDEFIRSLGNIKLVDFLGKFNDVAGIALQWILYNASGQIHYSSKPVRERFKQTIDAPHRWVQTYKSIIQPSKCSYMTPHHPIVLPPYLLVDENHTAITNLGARLSTTKIVIDHYYTKSYQEWRAKMKRGSCMNCIPYSQEMFEELNPGLLDQFLLDTENEAT